MSQKPNFDKIKADYESAYETCIRKRNEHIYPYLQDWQVILNTPHRTLYSDARGIGVPLYPYYPIGNRFIHLGNPFKKIGIELIYKGDDAADKKFRWEAFRGVGWTVYSLDSADTFLTINDHYQRVKAKYGNKEHFEDLTDEEDYENFITENKDKNAECLLYHIRFTYFDPSYISEERYF